MDFRKIKGQKHYVFRDMAEFEGYFKSEHGEVPILVPWREARTGDWIVADDGGVAQVLKWGPIHHPSDRKNWKWAKGYVRTVVGTFLQQDKVKMDTDFGNHPDRYRFNSATQPEVLHRRATRSQLSKQERIFAMALCTGKTLREAYAEAYGDRVDWRDRALFLLKRDRIIKLINKNVEEIAAAKGITHEYILEQLKLLLEETRNDQVKLSVLRELGDWIGGKEKTKQITRGEMHILPPINSNILAKIEAEKIETLTSDIEDD